MQLLIDRLIDLVVHKSIHSCMHEGIHSIIYSLVPSFVLLLVDSFVVRTTRSSTFFRYFSLKGQGDGEQPNQQGVEDNEQQGGEGGKS